MTDTLDIRTGIESQASDDTEANAFLSAVNEVADIDEVPEWLLTSVRDETDSEPHRLPATPEPKMAPIERYRIDTYPEQDSRKVAEDTKTKVEDLRRMIAAGNSKELTEDQRNTLKRKATEKFRELINEAKGNPKRLTILKAVLRIGLKQ